MREKAKGLICDLVKVLFRGVPAAACVSLILFFAGYVFSGSGVSGALETVKNGTLLIASLGMFLVAGMLLAKGKKPKKTEAGEGWRKHFYVIGMKSAIAVIAVSFLLAASIADRILMGMKI